MQQSTFLNIKIYVKIKSGSIQIRKNIQKQYVRVKTIDY